MNALKWTLGGLIGAIVGGSVWLGLSLLLDSRLDILACLMGVLTGFGVHRMARMSDSEIGPGGIAVLITLLAVALVKYHVTVSTAVSPYQEFWEMTLDSSIDEESMIATIADEIVTEHMERSQPVAWPDPEMTYEEALWKEDYPPEIWTEAERHWQSLSAADQQERMEERRVAVERVIHTQQLPERWAALGGSFGFWTVVWFALAPIAAFRMAVVQSDG